jgi:hypothetical protein
MLSQEISLVYKSKSTFHQQNKEWTCMNKLDTPEKLQLNMWTAGICTLIHYT